MSDVAAPATPQRDLRPLVIAGILGLALGWFAATSPISPVKPAPPSPTAEVRDEPGLGQPAAPSRCPDLRPP